MGNTFRWKARYTVVSVLFVTWIISYLDRMAMSVAMPDVAADFGLSPLQMGVVMSAFFASNAIAQIPGGLLSDKIGARKVTTGAILLWSVCSAVTGAASTLNQMLIVRFLFGLAEGLFPPSAFKAIAVWFPRRERTTANAAMFASNPLGVALAPIVMVPLVALWGWRGAFVCLLFPGIVVAILFWIYAPDKPSESRWVSPEELDEIDEGAPATPQVEQKESILEILKQPSVVKYCIVNFTYSISVWGFTAWLPTYLVMARGFSMDQMGIAASLPFFAGTLGCLFGGWVSDKYFSTSRRFPIISILLLSAVLLYFTYVSESVRTLVICQTIAGFFLMAIFSAFWALPMNTIPRALMGVAAGFINMAGLVAAFVAPIVIGYLIGVSSGQFDLVFLLLIASLLVSCAIVFSLPRQSRLNQEDLLNLHNG